VHVVVGAGGATGSALVRELLRRELPVRAVTRGGQNDLPVPVVVADASDPGQMREVCTGATAVYNCVNPPLLEWETVFPSVNEALISAAGAAEAVLVFADDTWMYGKVDGPMTEDLPSRPASRLGALRASLAAAVLDAHDRGDVQAVIARAGELYGPGVNSLLGDNLFSQALLGKRPVWFGRPDLPITPTYIGDFARGLATLADAQDTWGEVWHVPSGPGTTGRAFVETLCGQLGRPARMWRITKRTAWPMRLQSPMARLGVQILYQFEQPFVVDATKYRTRFSEEATSYEDGIAATLAWYQADPGRISQSLVKG
jgi:nucleoside-diphosphate-sugar epimerase